FLIQEAARLHSALQPYRRMQLQARNRLKTSFSEHEAIVEAISDHDEDRASALLRGHVMIQGEQFNDLIATLQSLEREQTA
ncbi:MAG: FCD domain-containing protein, partial [Oleiphilaceae bacterium]|nr:FCD domain-containing protein [Oleiphilaceae bacterium]